MLPLLTHLLRTFKFYYLPKSLFGSRNTMGQKTDIMPPYMEELKRKRYVNEMSTLIKV